MSTIHSQIRRDELTFLAISGIEFPTAYRRYLMDLFVEIAERHTPKFIVIAGGTVDGRALEKEFSLFAKNIITKRSESAREMRDEARSLKKKERETKKRVGKLSENAKILRERLEKKIQELETEAKRLEESADDFDGDVLRQELYDEFVHDQANALAIALPRIKDTNWHIVISDKVSDRKIGADILEWLPRLRHDVRLIGRQDDGSYDFEAKVGTRLRGLEEIRVLVPRKQPWYYRIISSFMQRLINSFVARTFSPPPQLILVGGTGTSVFLPYYEGVPSISVPVLHKLDEQQSTENMVGVTLVHAVSKNGHIDISHGFYDLRPAIFREKRIAIPKNLTPAQRAVMAALVPSDASLKVVDFRISESDMASLVPTVEDVKKILGQLIKEKLVAHNNQSNRFAISESVRRHADITLASLWEGSREVRHSNVSCFHAGCLKSLYRTTLHHLPQMCADSDAFIENGDGIQGIAHNYEYNGELLPITYGYDKQEVLLAHIRARNILDIFRLKFATLSGKRRTSEEVLDACFIKYVYNLGNHPAWLNFNKHATVLGRFDSELRILLREKLGLLCDELHIKISASQIASAVERKVVRVGESRIVDLDGVLVGIKHPFKGRTQSKSHRIQDVVDFIWRTFNNFAYSVARRADQQKRSFAIANVANFHECGAVHVAKFGRTVLGVMTGAYLKDTSFEANMDKVVEWGSAHVRVIIGADDRLLFSEVRYDNTIHPDDQQIAFAEHISTAGVLEVCHFLTEEYVDLPWR